MRILQIARSLDEECGIGYFARAMHRHLEAHGHQVKTQSELKAHSLCDVIVLHHHSELLDDHEVRTFAVSIAQPLILFPHADDARPLYGLASGLIAMAPRLLTGFDRPSFLLSHPAWTPQRLTDRRSLRATLGLPQDRIIIGTNGFVKFEREFDVIATRLVETGDAHGIFVYLSLSPWRLRSPGLVELLRDIERERPDRLRVDCARFKAQALNARLQACDLLWCWTRAESSAYASGVASDQYASGSRMIVAAKEQHAHVRDLENVIAVRGTIDDLCSRLLVESRAKRFRRHDPAPVAWARVVPDLCVFLSRFVH